MPVVPTFSDLPNVASAAPKVTPQDGVNRMQLALLQKPGEATEALGSAIEGDARTATNIADGMALQQNEQIAKTAAIQHQMYVNNLGFSSMDGQGGPAFYALKGQDAVNAAPAFLAAINAQREQAAEGMTVQAKNAYMLQTDHDIARETDAVQRHVMVQASAAATQTSQARIELAGTTAALRYNDPDAIESQAQVIRGEALDEARRGGMGPEATAAYTTSRLSSMYRGVVETAIAKGDVPTAAATMNKYGPQMTGPDFVHATEITKAPFLKLHAQQQGDQLLGGSPSAGGGGSMDQPYQPGAGYYDAVHGGEGNGVNAKTKASGPVQVIPSTQDEFHASPGNAGVDINTEAGARKFTQWYGDQNAQKIQAATGQPATMGQVVAAHLLGPEGATAILSHPNEPIGNHLSAGAIANNPGPLPGGPSMTGAEAATAISHYYAKASGNQFAGPGVPTATSVAAQKPPRPDFEGAIGAVPESPNDPDLHNATVSYLNERKNVYDMGETIQRKHLDETVIPQTLTALENGAVDTTVPELAIRQAHNKADADQIMSKIDDARQFGTLMNANKYASPDDINTQLTALHAKVLAGGDAATIAQAVKGESMLSQVLTKRQEQLKADPWTYVRQEPSVAAAYAADLSNPANVAAAIARSMAVQARLGAEPRSISQQSIDKNVSDLHSAAPSAVPGILDGLKGQYGTAWPTVFHDLVSKGHLNPDYQTLATMPTGSPGRVDFAAALAAKADKGEKFGAAAAENSPGAKASIEQRITKDLEGFQSSFQGSSGDGVIENYRGSVRTLATFYADRGMDPTQAAKTAFAQVLGNTDVSGFIRTPTTLNGQPFSAQKVLDAGRSVQRGLKDGDLQGVTAAQAQHGNWSTDPGGMSATLTVPNTTGGWRIVRKADGSPLQIDYRALPTGKSTAADNSVVVPAP